MEDVSKNEGRTVLFVSHNMGAIRQLCSDIILLDAGKISCFEKSDIAIKRYLDNPLQIKSSFDLVSDPKSRRGNGKARFTEIIINGGAAELDPQKDIEIKFTVEVYENIPNLFFSMILFKPDSKEFISNTGLKIISDKSLEKGRIFKLAYSIKANVLRTGLFPIYFWLGSFDDFGNTPFDVVDSVYNLNIKSYANPQVLGYDSNNPIGYFNIDIKLENV